MLASLAGESGNLTCLLVYLKSVLRPIKQIWHLIRFSQQWDILQRQSSKSCATNILRVHYSGEDGIDSGAMALEFLEKTIQEIGSKMFTGGTPIESSSHVQSGDFRTCGEIVAVSLALGRPPPCFLDQCSYDATFKDIDMTNITSEQLSSKELQLLSEVRSDCTKHVDLILEKGYTGPIDVEHIEAIIGSLKVCIMLPSMFCI